MNIKDEIIETLKWTEREGIEDFIQEMVENGFFEAPCSGGNHLCKIGGLAEHSLNVYKTAVKLAESLNYVDDGSIAIVTLLHDYGKTGDYGKKFYVDNVLKNGKTSTVKPFKRNTDVLEKNHAVKSIVMINRWIDLTEDEEFAILHHDGLYEMANREAMQKPTQLLLILHYADLWCSQVIEKTNESEEE